MFFETQFLRKQEFECGLVFDGDDAALVTGGEEPDYVSISKGGRVSLDTFFNLFSYSKYLKYTNVTNLRIELEIKGKAIVFLRRHVAWDGLPGSTYETETILSKEVNCPNIATVVLEHEIEELAVRRQLEIFDNNKPLRKRSAKVRGCYFVEILALDDDVAFHGGSYNTLIDSLNSVRLAIGICTYKREQELAESGGKTAVLPDGEGGHLG